MQRIQVKNYIASPLNYIGGKARILDQMLPLFPSDVDIFVDLFCGGCNVGMNYKSNYTIYNDISKPLISLIQSLRDMDNETIINGINKLIDEFGFSRTRDHNFAYYGGDANKGVSAYNREKYMQLREIFNSYTNRDNKYYIMLYTLILFGFNNQLRFNDKGLFNLPVGKRDFNIAIETKLLKFLESLRIQKHEFQTNDFRDFDFSRLTKSSLVYCDPPYLITNATYNEKSGWTVDDEKDLLDLLDRLNSLEIRFALSNVIHHEGKENCLLNDWVASKKYCVHNIFMDYHYSNYQKKIKHADSKEVLITNY